ncbi:flagellar basal body rod protein FlgF [Thioalkalivibrio sp. XN279]|uniref:flagellar basal body rod protein FlgF n=1 Tax=Thioalkalivibrio sp. XN279 TaxID=2714953 RepID=UPI00140A9823|nr:flagellar basal body rod protein FlgF [Thioalkalivibrio sp. XN279]NHA13383.1 flagellar basal body rod protein FlgF [Thioalkalivibrio sp. XN279]
MDRMIYLAMTGARETMLAQAGVSHNLANASTTGFKASLQHAQTQGVEGPGLPARAYAMGLDRLADLTPGALQSTGHDLDVAVDGPGWIAVQAPDGLEAYTRAGDLRVDALGRLTNGAGHPVMGEGGPIALPPFEKVEIGADGTVTLQPLGQPANALAVVERIRLVNPDPAGMQRGEDGLMRLEGGVPAPADAAVRLRTGMLEASNVNTVAALVDMIQLSRQFELQVKMMSAAEDADRASAELLRMR